MKFKNFEYNVKQSIKYQVKFYYLIWMFNQ